MEQKRVLMIVGGGIAAYKSLLLIRLLAKQNIATRVILTRAGAQFVTPLSLGGLSGDQVYQELFDLSDEAEMGHIQLSRRADLVVVVPATADLMAKAANGLANDLASTTLLATDKQVLFAPAMNVRMWEHAATIRNVKTLREDGALFVGPAKGEMACGEFGEGRMAGPEQICQAIITALEVSDPKRITDLSVGGSLVGKHVLITAGPTREPIDPVRYLSNRSSGKQGYAIAKACADLGAKVSLISGPVALDMPKNVDGVWVETAREMLSACEKALPADVFISVAAVADWRPVDAAALKIKKNVSQVPPLALTENPDILKQVSNHKNRPELVIGFAAETNDVIKHAQAKLARKKCDWIVANDVSGDVMGGDNNTMILIDESGQTEWPLQSKSAAAHLLAMRISKHFTQ